MPEQMALLNTAAYWDVIRSAYHRPRESRVVGKMMRQSAVDVTDMAADDN